MPALQHEGVVILDHADRNAAQRAFRAAQQLDELHRRFGLPVEAAEPAQQSHGKRHFLAHPF